MAGGGSDSNSSAGYNFSQLEDLWKRNGGNPTYAPIAAAVALAESSGNPNASNGNSNGSVDRGLWQINSTHGSLSTFNPDGNAKAAIQISNNGSDWKPWCTAYTDGACGSKGGSFSLGSGSPAGKILASKGANVTIPAQNNIGDSNGGSGNGSGSGSNAQNASSLSDFLGNAVTTVVLPIIQLFVMGAIFLVGGSLLVSGILLMVYDSGTGRDALNKVGQAAAIAGM